ncbi:MAG: hypothetical protein KJ734_03815, partial [Chloroflexi bacterium]|nr:hypothetical protein [Chloroflexota bacterium]
MNPRWLTLTATLIVAGALLVNLSGSARRAGAAADLPVYTDALAAGWQDWSYGSVTSNYANASQ